MSKPYLYILMRGDLDSFNAGKKMAHAAHASNAFVHKMDRLNDAHPLKKLYLKWAKETPQGFGTTIVLIGTLEAFEKATAYIENDGGIGIRQDNGVAFGIVHDPSYPLRDGEITHLIPLDTCAWFFCEANDVNRSVLKDFSLHP